MKLVKKLLTAVIALVMMLGMSIRAMAADEYSITVKNDNPNITIDGKTYTAYKLFDATYSGEGENAAVSYTIAKDSYFYTNTETKAILDEYFTFTATSGDANNLVVTPKEEFKEEKARELADKLQPYLSVAPVAGSAEARGETAMIELSEPGYYLVDGTANPADGSGSEIVAAVALTTAKPTAEVHPKADAPSVDKKITEINEDTDKVEAGGKTGNGSVGDKVEYELTSKVPNMTGYEKYQFIYTDTMSKGLTFNDDVTITIGGNEYSNDKYTATKVINDNGTTTITITFINFIEQKEHAGEEIKISYSATINENAAETGQEENTVTLQYSNNPYDEHAGTPDEVLGETPESKTKVYDTNIRLEKVDEEGNTLTGAKFKIEGDNVHVCIVNSEIYEESVDGTWYRLKDGTYTQTAPTDPTADQYDGDKKYELVEHVTQQTETEHIVREGWVDEEGILTFNGLGEGTYTITELVAPEGYNLLSKSIKVEITFDATTGKFFASIDEEEPIPAEGLYIPIEVENNKGQELPSTGGMGTTIFYTLGGMLVLCAGVLLVSRRRMTE